jgi:hypothetical protein
VRRTYNLSRSKVTLSIRLSHYYSFLVCAYTYSGVETYTVDDWVTAVFIDDAPEEATFGVSTAPFNSLTAAATSVGRGCGTYGGGISR